MQVLLDIVSTYLNRNTERLFFKKKQMLYNKIYL